MRDFDFAIRVPVLVGRQTGLISSDIRTVGFGCPEFLKALHDEGLLREWHHHPSRLSSVLASI